MQQTRPQPTRVFEFADAASADTCFEAVDAFRQGYAVTIRAPSERTVKPANGHTGQPVEVAATPTTSLVAPAATVREDLLGEYLKAHPKPPEDEEQFLEAMMPPPEAELATAT